MIDAPERIYAWVYRDGDRMLASCICAVSPCGPFQTEYIRADLATPMRCAECDCEKGGADCKWIATPNPLDDPRVKAVVEALRYMVRHAGQLEEGDGIYWEATEKARAALAALEKNK